MKHKEAIEDAISEDYFNVFELIEKENRIFLKKFAKIFFPAVITITLIVYLIIYVN